jgi:glycosyltransferase involved in cell wall biosynthesis
MPGANVALDIIGDGPLSKELRDLAQSLSLTQKLTWHGWVDLDVLPQLYRSAHALILPSRFEGMASVVLQAMACGSTVVSSDVFGARDIVTDGRDGYIVPVDDPAALAGRIEMLQHPRTRHALRSAALDTVRGFSWTAIAARLESTYLGEVLGK